LKRIWTLLSASRPGGAATDVAAVALDLRLLATNCSNGADTLAVFVRATLLNMLIEGGMLDQWREGDGLPDFIFKSLAAFPLPEGMIGFNPPDFLAALQRR
jgi:hypothetical protein